MSQLERLYPDIQEMFPSEIEQYISRFREDLEHRVRRVSRAENTLQSASFTGGNDLKERLADLRDMYTRMLSELTKLSVTIAKENRIKLLPIHVESLTKVSDGMNKLLITEHYEYLEALSYCDGVSTWQEMQQCVDETGVEQEKVKRISIS